MQQAQQTSTPPSIPVRVLLAVIGGLVGLAITIAIGAAVLYILAMALEAMFGPYRVRRVGAKAGLALIVVPLAGAVWGVAIGWNLHQHKFGARLKPYLAIDTDSMLDRAWIAWAAIWSTATVILVPMVGPIWRGSSYWYFERDALATLVWWIMPIAGGFVFSRIVAWVMRGSR
jgi:hypothetical protein